MEEIKNNCLEEMPGGTPKCKRYTVAQSQMKGPKMKNCMGETKRRVGARRTRFGGSGFARVMRSSRLSDAAKGASRTGWARGL